MMNQQEWLEEDEPSADDEYEEEEEEEPEVVVVRVINVNNSNYLWVHYTGTGIKELNLIDSGAQVSVIPKKLYDKISDRKRTALMTAAVDIKAGNGSSIKC